MTLSGANHLLTYEGGGPAADDASRIDRCLIMLLIAYSTPELRQELVRVTESVHGDLQAFFLLFHHAEIDLGVDPRLRLLELFELCWRDVALQRQQLKISALRRTRSSVTEALWKQPDLPKAKASMSCQVTSTPTNGEQCSAYQGRTM